MVVTLDGYAMNSAEVQAYAENLIRKYFRLHPQQLNLIVKEIKPLCVEVELEKLDTKSSVQRILTATYKYACHYCNSPGDALRFAEGFIITFNHECDRNLLSQAILELIESEDIIGNNRPVSTEA